MLLETFVCQLTDPVIGGLFNRLISPNQSVLSISFKSCFKWFGLITSKSPGLLEMNLKYGPLFRVIGSRLLEGDNGIQNILPLCKMTGMGYEWPEIERGSDISAVEVIWSFLSKHSRSGLVGQTDYMRGF